MSFAKTGPEIARLHPEMSLGGYTALDGTIEFYMRIKAVARKDFIAVDVGAGRGAWYEEDESRQRREMRLLKGHVARVIGCDIDPVVLENRAVDEVRLLEVGKRWPFDDQSVDLVVSDYVLEHVTDADAFASEVRRVLKPGGWLCARTPTKYNYVCIAARMIANARHARVLQLAQPGRKPEDVFPTSYRLNSRKDIGRVFRSTDFDDWSYIYTPEPPYHFGRVWVYRSLQLLHRLLPASLTGQLFVFLQRR